MPCRSEQPIEDLCFSAHIELGSGFVEQHDTGAKFDRRKGSRKGDPLPLAAGQVGAPSYPRASTVSSPARFAAPAASRAARTHCLRAGGRHIIPQRQFETHEVLEHGCDPRSPRRHIELADVDAIDFDCARLWIAYNLHSSFAIVVLPAPFCPTMASDEPAGIVRSKFSSTAFPLGVYAKVTSRRRISRAGLASATRLPDWSARRAHRRLEPQHCVDRGGRAIEGPAESAECDSGNTDSRLYIHHSLGKTDAAVAAALASVQKTRTLAATTRSRLQKTGFRVDGWLRTSSCRRVRLAMKRAIVQSTRPNSRSSLLAGGSTASRYA